ncbi:hypothetical protein V6N13_019845 [Hibiscus sabdariffa]
MLILSLISVLSLYARINLHNYLARILQSVRHISPIKTQPLLIVKLHRPSLRTASRFVEKSSIPQSKLLSPFTVSSSESLSVMENSLKVHRETKSPLFSVVYTTVSCPFAALMPPSVH